MFLAAALLSGWLLADGNAPLHSWTIQSYGGNQYSVSVELREGSGDRTWMEEHSYDVSASDFSKSFEGLTTDQLNSSSGTHVHFRIKRDAGALDCDGWAHNGNASGDFSVTPDPAFAAELDRRGIGRPTAEQQRLLVFADGGAIYDLLNALRDNGYGHPSSVDQLLDLVNHGVSTKYVKSLAQAHISGRSIDDLIRARDHGISSRYVVSIQSAGYANMQLDDLVRARDHGLSSSFLEDMSSAGYKNLSTNDLVRLRDHGVSGTYVRDLTKLGYHPSVDELVELRDHGVSANYVEYLSHHGFNHLSVADLIRMRDHGI